VNTSDYDKYIVAFSGGKDSIACFLNLLEIGIPKEKIELMHHLIDGSPEEKAFMDWEVTEDYCRKFAAHFGVPIYFSWRDKGFKGEMLKQNKKTAATVFECPERGVVTIPSDRAKESTRLKFPQVTANLMTRWCSANLKIDICKKVITQSPRFNGKNIIIISGERAEESASRAKYADMEKDATDASKSGKRFATRWRPIHKWTEQKVWAIIEKYKVVVHPCYYMGYSRCSCKFCIFGNADQFATAFQISPEIGQEIADYEVQFGTTIKRNDSVLDLVEKGTAYGAATKELMVISTSRDYNFGIVTQDEWELPSGAYGEGCGPS